MARPDAPKRHGGRPKKAEARTKSIKVRLTEGEYAELVRRAKVFSGSSSRDAQDAAGEAVGSLGARAKGQPARLGISAYVRQVALEGAVVLERPQLAHHLEWRELGRLSSNLNQIARGIRGLDARVLSGLGALPETVLEARELVERLRDELLSPVPLGAGGGEGEGQ